MNEYRGIPTVGHAQVSIGIFGSGSYVSREKFLMKIYSGIALIRVKMSVMEFCGC